MLTEPADKLSNYIPVCNKTWAHIMIKLIAVFGSGLVESEVKVKIYQKTSHAVMCAVLHVHMQALIESLFPCWTCSCNREKMVRKREKVCLVSYQTVKLTTFHLTSK